MQLAVEASSPNPEQPIELPLLPAAADVPSASGTTITDAQINSRNSSTATVVRLNADRRNRYLSGYADYVAQMTSGVFVPEDRRVPPKPPVAWELAPPDANGMIWYQLGTTPVCPQPPTPAYNAGLMPVMPIPNHIHIGAQIPDGHGGFTLWFQAGDDDGVPSGQTVPNPDSPTDGHMYEKFGSTFKDFGKGGLYLQVK